MTSTRSAWSPPSRRARSRSPTWSTPRSPGPSGSSPTSTRWRTPPTTGPAPRPATREAASSPASRRSSRTTSTSPACRPSRAATPSAARRCREDGDFARMFLATGLVPLGKTQLSEFGFSPSAEHPRLGPVRSPWDTAHTAGASSAGTAALVAAGAVPLAHGNDGGGSIRIPAAVNGLVGLKPTRDRLAQDKINRQMPVRIVSDGVADPLGARHRRVPARGRAGLPRAAAAADRRRHPPGPQAAAGRGAHRPASAGRRPRRSSS